MPDDTIRTKIERAIRSLPVKPESHCLVKPAVEALTLLADNRGPQGNPRNWRAVRGRELKRELQRVMRAHDRSALTKVASGLSATAINLLADANPFGDGGWMRSDPDIARAHAAANAALELVQSPRWQPPSPDRGRPPKLRNDGITAVAADYYQRLTGIRPARSTVDAGKQQAGMPTGPFYRFMLEVFRAAGINTNPTAAIVRYMKRKVPSPVDWKQCEWRQIDQEWHFLPDGHDRESSIARIYHCYGSRWCASITRQTNYPNWASFSTVDVAQEWVKEQFAKDELYRNDLEAGICRLPT